MKYYNLTINLTPKMKEYLYRQMVLSPVEISQILKQEQADLQDIITTARNRLEQIEADLTYYESDKESK